MKPEQKSMQLELTPEVAKGIYSNLAIISHGQSEFFLDFALLSPGVPKTFVQSRIILAPQHAKHLLNALQENVRKYERTYGEIKDEENIVPNNIPPFAGGNA